MGIWIRSQDKTSLAECKTIDIVKRVNDEYHIHANFMDFDYVFLGKYSSKEKAIAVLDMIEEKIIADKSNILHAIYREQNGNAEENMIFQMPQDDEVEV